MDFVTGHFGKMNLCPVTLNKTEIIYSKNVGASAALNFTKEKYSAPMAIEKIKILLAVLELPAKQHCQFGQFGQFGPVLR